MVTVLEYLVIAAAIGLVVFVLAVFVFGRGEQMAPLSPRISPAELPDAVIVGEDVRRIRFSLALRGYRMSDVDWTLDRVSAELDRLHRRVAELSGEPLPPGVAAEADDDLFPEDGDRDDEPVLAGVGVRRAEGALDDTAVIPRVTERDASAEAPAAAEPAAKPTAASEPPRHAPDGPAADTGPA